MYLINSNSVAAFADECIEASAGDTLKKVVYEEYINWCLKNEIKPKTNAVFGKYFKENWEFADSGNQLVIEIIITRIVKYL
ncbi:MAG: primase-like DNA-binding domain-containing protein [Methanolobus sp.]